MRRAALSPFSIAQLHHHVANPPAIFLHGPPATAERGVATLVSGSFMKGVTEGNP